MRSKARPLPRAAREDNGIVEFLVALDHVIEDLTVEGVIVPVYERYVCGHLCHDLGCYLALAHAVCAAERHAEEHIAPHHRLISDLGAHLCNAVKVLEHYLVRGTVTVEREIFTSAEHMSLVHTDVDAL